MIESTGVAASMSANSFMLEVGPLRAVLLDEIGLGQRLGACWR